MGHGGGTRLGIDRYENDRVEMLGDHGFDLVVLGHGVIVAVEHGQFHGAVLDRRVFLYFTNPVLHVLALETVHRGADLVGLFLGEGDAAGEQGGSRQRREGFAESFRGKLHGKLHYCFSSLVQWQNLAFLLAPDVDEHREHDDQTLGNLLVIRGHPEQVQTVVDHADQQGAEQGADDAAGTAGEAGAADHHGGDGVQFIRATGLG
ncbi:hypothetical protein D3C75_873120 [compost metagenome]